jgi:hypothetical protein
MSENQDVKMSREQLYNEIWTISVAGVAKKYAIPYARLLKLCEEAFIPIPPSGYWTKLNFGKPVTQTPLPESLISEVILSRSSKKKPSKRSDQDVSKLQSNAKNEKKTDADKQSKLNQEIESKTDESLKKPETHHFVRNPVSGKRNTYNREKLYEEVWSKPVIEVAVHYGVSDVALHKICKYLNVPVPPRGYWSKLRAGKKVKRIPLPAKDGPIETKGVRTFEAVKVNGGKPQLLPFLDEDECHKILMSIQQIEVYTEGKPTNKKLLSHKSVIKRWNISVNSLSRIYTILDTLYNQIENLGGSVNSDLSIQIRNEKISIEMSEAQDQVKHELTKQEARALIMYEDEKKCHSWAKEPIIPQYNYVYNGRLRINIGRNRYFRDTNKANIESRLGDVIIALYEQSEVIRIDREAREEEQRKREEEQRLREERRKRYNREIERTIALVNWIGYTKLYRKDKVMVSF